MAIEVLCVCGQFLKAKPEFAGKRIKCPHCGAGLLVPGSPSPAPAAGPAAPETISLSDGPIPFEIPTVRAAEPATAASPATAATATAPVAAAPRTGGRPGLEYKVIMHKDMGFTTRFDPSKLEEALNRFSGEGWGVRSAVVLNLPGHAGAHDELVVILER